MPTDKRNEIQWLRTLAALEVTLWHSDLITKHFSDHLLHDSQSYQPLGGIGVELFFIVSGYVICMRAPSYKTGLAFIWARIARLFPMYWMFTSLVLLASIINPVWRLHGLSPDPSSLLQSFLILPQQKDPILGVGWTLEHEMVFYAAVAAMMIIIGRSWQRYKIPFAFFLVGAGLLGCVLGTGPSMRLWDFHLLSPYLMAFAVGWLARTLDEMEWTRATGIILTFLGIGVVAAFMADPRDVHLVYRIVLAASIFAAFSFLRSPLNTPNFINNWIGQLGDASYSLYLCHWFILSSLGKLLGVIQLPAEFDPVIRIVGIAVCVIVSLGLYRWVEKPIDRTLRGSSGSQQPRPVKVGLGHRKLNKGPPLSTLVKNGNEPAASQVER